MPGIETIVNDAHDEPDTGKPPCDFCRRTVPCECSTFELRRAGDTTCMCTCGRCKVIDVPAWIFGEQEEG